MAFNPSDISTDIEYGFGRPLWRPWKPPVKPVKPVKPALLDQCCESQLEFIKYNFAKFDKKITKDFFWTSDDFEELLVWQRMFGAIQKGMNADTTPRNDTLLSEIFEMQQVIRIKYEDRIVTATEINLIVHLRDNTQITGKISVRKEDSIFDEMTKCLEFDKWGSVMLRGRGVDVYLKENRPNGDSTREFTKQQIDNEGRTKILEHQLKGDLLRFEIRESTPYTETKYTKKNPAASDAQKEDEKIEITKRFIPHTTTTPDEAGESHEAEASSLAARFQSITWV
jgi:hypothetical protein